LEDKSSTGSPGGLDPGGGRKKKSLSPSAEKTNNKSPRKGPVEGVHAKGGEGIKKKIVPLPLHTWDREGVRMEQFKQYRDHDRGNETEVVKEQKKKSVRRKSPHRRKRRDHTQGKAPAPLTALTVCIKEKRFST